MRPPRVQPDCPAAPAAGCGTKPAWTARSNPPRLARYPIWARVMDSNKDWHQRLYVMVFQSDTPAGRRFDSTLLLLILASLVVVILDSIQEVHDNYANVLAYIEWGFTIIFAIEYGLRLYCSPKPLRYAFSFYGLVDLLAIVRGIQQKIVVFLLSVCTLVTVFGTLMYVIEGPEHGFTSIPKGIYWAIVTLTTVGFGDIVPKTPLGQVISSLVMITGYSIIAVPTGIFTAELANAMRGEQLQTDCPVCKKNTHDANAAFCSRCGNALFKKLE